MPPLPRTAWRGGEIGFVRLLSGFVLDSCLTAHEGGTRTEPPEVTALAESRSERMQIRKGRGSVTGSDTTPLYPHSALEVQRAGKANRGGRRVRGSNRSVDVLLLRKRDDTRRGLTVFRRNTQGLTTKEGNSGGSSLRVTVSRRNRGRGPPIALRLPRRRSAASWTVTSEENSLERQRREPALPSHRTVPLGGGS